MVVRQGPPARVPEPPALFEAWRFRALRSATKGSAFGNRESRLPARSALLLRRGVRWTPAPFEKAGETLLFMRGHSARLGRRFCFAEVSAGHLVGLACFFSVLNLLFKTPGIILGYHIAVCV